MAEAGHRRRVDWYDRIMSRVENIPPECWRERVDPAHLVQRWADFPSLSQMLSEFAAEMLPGDELWFYDIGAFTGLAIRRSGVAVKTDTYLHAYVSVELIVRWANRYPTTSEIFAMRKLDFRLREMPLHEARKILAGAPSWRLGPYSSSDEAKEVEKRCRELGLRVVSR
jgi:hypothetical protein